MGLQSTSQHLIIGGTGRAGTTLLVQFFTACGLDTGYTLEQAMSKVDGISKAGLEHSLYSKQAPYVIKAPWLSSEIDDVLREGKTQINMAIIPIRAMYEVVESRWAVQRQHFDINNPHIKLVVPGGLWGTQKKETQEKILTDEFYKFLFPLVQHEIPIVFLEFPRFATDVNYFLRAMQPCLLMNGISQQRALEAHKAVVRPELIHSF